MEWMGLNKLSWICKTIVTPILRETARTSVNAAILKVEIRFWFLRNKKEFYDGYTAIWEDNNILKV
jgi:hypothetical protein